MLKAYTVEFYKIGLRLQGMRSRAELHSTSESQIYERDQDDFRAVLHAIQEECANLELKHTRGMALSIELRFQGKLTSTTEKYTYPNLLNDADTLRTSLNNELREEVIFRIASKRKEFFENRDLFGSAVNTAFPSSIDEIRSAGNCFAVEQWDACAFHLMRVLERGLGVLATKFGVTFLHTNWHNVIEQIEVAVRRMDSSFGADWKEQQKFFSQAASQFMFFKDAWRNHVMHARDVYDEGKALSIFNHVCEFMKALAQGGLSEEP